MLQLNFKKLRYFENMFQIHGNTFEIALAVLFASGFLEIVFHSTLLFCSP